MDRLIYNLSEVHFVNHLSFISAFESVKLSLSNNENSLLLWHVPLSCNVELHATLPQHFYS
jgi:hypothetical protein